MFHWIYLLSAPLLLMISMFKSPSSPIVEYVNRDEARRFVRSDKDGFSQSLSVTDLRARGVHTLDEYKNKISSAFVDADPLSRKILNKSCLYLDNFIKRHHAIDLKDLLDVEWKIALFKDKAYENGLPHTRADIIFLPIDSLYSNSLHNTLLHEKIHLLQRLKPNCNLVRNYMKRFTPYMPLEEFSARFPLAQSNPDINDMVYKNDKHQVLMEFYTSDYPASIEDTIGLQHPYEQMAYDVSYQAVFLH